MGRIKKSVSAKRGTSRFYRGTQKSALVPLKTPIRREKRTQTNAPLVAKGRPRADRHRDEEPDPTANGVHLKERRINAGSQTQSPIGPGAPGKSAILLVPPLRPSVASPLRPYPTSLHATTVCRSPRNHSGRSGTSPKNGKAGMIWPAPARFAGGVSQPLVVGLKWEAIDEKWASP